MSTNTSIEIDANAATIAKWFLYGFALSFVALNVRGIAGFFYSIV